MSTYIAGSVNNFCIRFAHPSVTATSATFPLTCGDNYKAARDKSIAEWEKTLHSAMNHMVFLYTKGHSSENGSRQILYKSRG